MFVYELVGESNKNIRMVNDKLENMRKDAGVVQMKAQLLHLLARSETLR
jgi:hypothetical protein